MRIFKCWRSPGKVKSSSFLSERQIAMKESFQSILPPKTHRNTHEEGKRWETFLALKGFRAFMCFFFFFWCGSGDLWIELAHSNQPWFASYVGKQHWTNNEPQNRKKNLWPWNEPSLCSSVRLLQIVVWYTATGLYITLHSSSAILDGIHPVHIQLIGAGFGIHLITAAVRNKDVNFIWIYSLGPRFIVRYPYQKESVL